MSAPQSPRELWDAQTEKKRALGKRERRNQARVAVAAEQWADKLAHGTEWPKFQSLVVEMREHALIELKGIGPALLDPKTVEHADFIRLQSRGLVLEERIRTLSVVLDLPKMVQKDAEAARGWLKENGWTEPPDDPSP